MKVLKKIDSVIEAVTTVICTILFAGIIIIGFVAVIFRYVINNPLMWSEEVMRFMAIWMILLGSSLLIAYLPFLILLFVLWYLVYRFF